MGNGLIFTDKQPLSFGPFHDVLRETEGAAGCSVGDSLLSGACCLYPSLNWICAREMGVMKSPRKHPWALLLQGPLGMCYYLDDFFGRLHKIASAVE